MRLHNLTLQAFGPFAEQQHIDFDQLGASGLFLLEGPTGAGKSSILDAITFALYGAPAGLDAGADRVHSHFAHPQLEPRAVLEFSVRGQRHRISRVPEWQRPKLRGEGRTRAPSTVHLQRHDGGSWTSVSSSKAETGEVIGELIGLNRDQFTQVVLLPQGQFARFLSAGDDDRRVVLTRLFGSQLYDHITAQLHERRNEAVRTLAEGRARVTEALSAAAEAAGLDEGERETLRALDDAQRRPQLDALGRRLLAVQDACRVESTRQRALLVAATQTHDDSRRRNETAARLVTAQAALARHEQSRPEHKSVRTVLGAALRAEYVRPALRAIDVDRAAVVLAQDGLTALITSRADRWTGLVADLGALNESGQPGDMTDLSSWARQLSRGATQGRQLAVALAPAVQVEALLAQVRDRLTIAQQQAAAAGKRAARLHDRLAELPALIATAKSALRELRERASGLERSMSMVADLATRLRAARSLVELDALLVRARSLFSATVERHQATVDEHQRLVEARLDGMAAELAGQLVDGAPCSVCGALKHPAPASPLGDAITAAAVAAAQKARRVEEGNRQAAAAEVNRLDRERSAASAVAGAVEPAAYSLRLARAEAELDLARESIRLLPEAEARLTEREVEQDALNAALRPATANATAAEKAAEHVAIELADAEDTVEQALDGFASVADRQTHLRHAADLDEKLATTVDELARATQAATRSERAGAELAREHGFDDVDMARCALRPLRDQHCWQDQVKVWDTEDATLTASARTADAAAADLLGAQWATVRSDVGAWLRATERELTGAAQVFEQIRTDETATQGRSGLARRTAERFQGRRDELDRLVASWAEQELRTRTVLHLADLARGVDGHRRVNLTTYVLRHWFARVVEAANLRLAAMSCGRYLLVRTDAASNKRERTGLTLGVLDQHTGEQRSTASMSGGEIFYTSLALALGLADVVKAEAGGVELDTLFIDEGFGSLDTETLDQVMAVIDDLRERGRVIGIVSHVGDLKERIPERLEVRRRRDGSSVVRLSA